MAMMSTSMAASSGSDDLTVIINGKSYGGWQAVRVSRGAERVPASFDISATERYPGQLSQVAIEAGNPCQIKIGADLVLTGYVDRVAPTLSPTSHDLRIQGRSKLEDIVDCSVTSQHIAGMQYVGGSLVDLATKICSPFDIPVRSLTGDQVMMLLPGGLGPAPINVILGETGYEVIERVARYVQVLVYEDVDGTLLLARAGAGGAMGSGFSQGVNVQSASGVTSMDQRYSDYLPAILSYQLFDQGPGPALGDFKDAGVPRYRPLYVVSEQFGYGQSMAVLRAKWEMARRYGRSQAVRLVTDSWRDTNGKRWTPNNTVPTLSIPALKLAPTKPWVIAEVTYSRDAEGGTTAELELMPPEAFTQEPIILMPFGWYAATGNVPAGGAAP